MLAKDPVALFPLAGPTAASASVVGVSSTFTVGAPIPGLATSAPKVSATFSVSTVARTVSPPSITLFAEVNEVTTFAISSIFGAVTTTLQSITPIVQGSNTILPPVVNPPQWNPGMEWQTLDRLREPKGHT